MAKRTKFVDVVSPKMYSLTGTSLRHSLTSNIVLKYKRLSKLGKFLKLSKQVRVTIPKKSTVTRIENNKPRVGMVRVSYK